MMKLPLLLKEKTAIILEQDKGRLTDANFNRDHMHILSSRQQEAPAL